MILTQKTVLLPTTISVAEQIEAALQDQPHEGAVVLVPEGDASLKIIYRGTGGAWWTAEFNQPGRTGGALPRMLEGVKEAMLITRRDVDASTARA